MFVGGSFTLATTFVSMKIEDYSKQLEQCCEACYRHNKCKVHTRICARKKLVFNAAKLEYQRRKKKGVIKDDGSS